MKRFTLILLAAAMLTACASGPVLGTPTLLQQALNSLPAISVAGTSLQFQFGGKAWIAKLNGANFSGGTIKQIETDDGFLLTLKQTHMSPSAIPGAVVVPGVNWVAMAGPDIVFEYKAGPPMAIRLLSKEEIAERLGDTDDGESVGAGAGTATATGELPENLQNDSQVAHLLGGSPTNVAASSTTTTPTTAMGAAKKAPAEKVVVFAGNGHRYEVINSNKSWTNARKDCEKRGGYLATITSSEEQQFIEDFIKTHGRKSSYWLGGFKEKGKWLWVTGEPFEYTNWASGQPDNHQGKENKLNLWEQTHLWNDDEPTRQTYYICEWDDVTDPTLK